MIDKKTICYLIFITFFSLALMKFITLSDDAVKLVIGICMTVITLILYRINKIYVLYLIVFSISLPIHIRFMQRDAATITTLLIVMFFILEWISGDLKLNIINKYSLILLILFFIINTISLLNLQGEELITNLRQYLAFISSLMLFILIISMTKDIEELNKLLIVIGSSILLQVFVSILSASNVNLSFLKIFTSRTSEFLTVSTRPGGIIDDYELLAEWYAVFIPFAIWLIYNFKTRILGLIFIIFLSFGIILTKTRGAIMSLGVGMLFFLIFFQNRYIFKKLGYVIIIGLILCIGWLFVKLIMPTWYENIINRFGLAIKTYQEGGSFMEVINRQDIWKNFFDKYYIFKLFGTGKRYPGGQEGSFHSLYFTLFYQVGILGFLVFSGFLINNLLLLVKRILKPQQTKYMLLQSLSLASLVVFISDEVKIEYLRASYFSQFAWMIFGIVILTTWFNPPEESNR